MDVSALEWGKGKKGKGKDKGKGKGKTPGQASQPARDAGAWWSGYADSKNKSKGKGKGQNLNWDRNRENHNDKRWVSTYFAGYCSYCKKWGHKKADCHFYKEALKKSSPEERKKREEMRAE